MEWIKKKWTEAKDLFLLALAILGLAVLLLLELAQPLAFVKYLFK
jgi:hypothetical protein